jgi:hypothetical protein
MSFAEKTRSVSRMLAWMRIGQNVWPIHEGGRTLTYHRSFCVNCQLYHAQPVMNPLPRIYTRYKEVRARTMSAEGK